MAMIILEPKEVFEHSHSAESVTRVLKGEIFFEVGGERRRLTVGTEVQVAPNRAHRLINIGPRKATIACYHHPPKE